MSQKHLISTTDLSTNHRLFAASQTHMHLTLTGYYFVLLTVIINRLSYVDNVLHSTHSSTPESHFSKDK